MRDFPAGALIVVIIGLILGLIALAGCVPSDAGQCRPHTFQLGC